MNYFIRGLLQSVGILKICQTKNWPLLSVGNIEWQHSFFLSLMQIHIVTAFPKFFESPLGESMMKRASQSGAVEFCVHDLRDYTTDKHRSVDDYPYGGGPGMIMKPEPFFACVEHLRRQEALAGAPVILMSPQGERFSQHKAKTLAQERALIFLCGHYKGVDERVHHHLATEEISIGDYVVTGGELPALVVIDAVVRLLPGVLGDLDSASGDSFQSGLLDYPHYTRPEEFRGWRVPEILLSGHHAKIAQWRREQAESRTRERRKDLLE
jgi:tRNA (guanine37-N1)-methyltransferase